MKKLLLLLLLTSCATVPLPEGCETFINKIETGIETITQIGTTCLQPDGTTITKIDTEIREIKPIYIPPVPNLPKK